MVQIEMSHPLSGCRNDEPNYQITNYLVTNITHIKAIGLNLKTTVK